MSNMISSAYLLDAMICEDDEYKCQEGYPACIHTSWICDGYPQCMNKDDENTCGEWHLPFIKLIDMLCVRPERSGGKCGEIVFVLH